MLRYALLIAGVLCAVPCAAKDIALQPAPAAFTAPGVQEMGEAQADLCRAYVLETAKPGADRTVVWNRVTRGMTPSQQKLTAAMCVVYSKAWQQGTVDIVTSGVAHLNK